MSEFVVAFTGKRLGDLLIQEATVLLGVREQVEQMQTELNLMQSFLKDADTRQYDDERIRFWVSEIREAAYKSENVIETFAFKIASRQRGGIRNAFKRYACIIDEAAELHKVGSEIEAIKSRISNLRASLQTYGITAQSEGGGSSSAHGTQQRRQSYSHVVEEYIVGLDGDIEILVTQLVNEEKHCGVVSICGMGGLGKTTLAKRIYHHNVIRRYFDGFAWVSISQQFQRRDVWEGILFSLISPSKEQREGIIILRDDELAAKLYQVLQEKKCFVVLDDIWRTNAWDSLSPAFPVGKANSKLLLTTRNKEVALHVDPRGFLHEPQCLTEEESWELLQKKAFPRKDEPGFTINIAMEELGRKMAARCAGLPLAIIVLGGILATKHTLNEWDIVHENIKLYLRRGKGHDQQESGVSQVLALSYYELPYQLKPCFLHLCNFPEDFDIPTKKLVRIWMAEGLVSPILEREGTIEDVARCYLGELLDRCMVQVGLRGSTGRIKTIRLHDLMRDLCLLKANEENFLKVIHSTQDGNEQMVSFSSTKNISKSSLQVHRLAIHLGEKDDAIFYWERERSPYLRSLLIGGYGYVASISKRMNSWFTDFKLLKILDIMNRSVKGKLLNAIGNLINLRYLSLNFIFASHVPSSFGNLRCLQTLILSPIEMRVINMANVIWRMEHLRHLYLPNNIRKNGDKLRLGNLSNLQTLVGFNTSCCDVKDLTKLTNLKKLRIRMESIKELEEILITASVTLSRLRSFSSWVNSSVTEVSLQRLVLACPHLYKLCLGGTIVKLPEYHHFPPNLTKLTLQRSQLVEDPMATLEKLPNLSILRFSHHVFTGKEMVCSSKGFPQLKSLCFVYLMDLEEWCVAEEAMPSLRELRIENCEKLKMVPDGLRFITTLRELEIIRMPEAFKKRLEVVNEEGGEASYKVQHVPSVIFKD